MSTPFAVDPEELDAAAARFDEAGRLAAETLAALRSALAALGDPVGTDDQGRAFAARYDPAVADGTTAMRREATSLAALGDALRATAAAHRALDDAAARSPGGG